jgi:hypothetical protein
MKPTNTKIPPCNPISSNCVVWQGPDIECIGLCKGDTVSDVVAKLATELCNLLDQLKINTYDLSCLGTPGCPPASFHDLIQLIIDKICEQNNLPTSTASTCPDCIVPIAPCLQYFNPANGDLVTQGQLLDYIQLIANKVCYLVEQLDAVLISGARTGGSTTVINNTVDLPSIVPQCVLPSTPTSIEIVLSALESQFCNLLNAVGTPTAIYTTMTRECTDLPNQERLYGSGVMSSIPGWIVAERTLADNLNNMWLTICDMRAAIIDIKLNCCPGCCDGVDVTLQAALFAGGAFRIYLTGTIPAGFVECSSAGTPFTISDGVGGSIVVNIPVLTALNNPTGYFVDLSVTPLNLSSNLNVRTILCLTPADPTTGCSECQSLLEYVVINTLNCPTITFTSTLNSISYTFNHITGSATYVVELWNSSLSTMISSQTIPAPVPQTITGTFSGLTSGTTYYIRVKIIVGSTTSTCGFNEVATLPNPCPPPTGVYVTFEYAIT